MPLLTDKLFSNAQLLLLLLLLRDETSFMVFGREVRAQRGRAQHQRPKARLQGARREVGAGRRQVAVREGCRRTRRASSARMRYMAALEAEEEEDRQAGAVGPVDREIEHWRRA